MTCGKTPRPVLPGGAFSGRHFDYKDGHFGQHGQDLNGFREGLSLISASFFEVRGLYMRLLGAWIHLWSQECHESFLRQWAPKCLHCQEPLLKLGRRAAL